MTEDVRKLLGGYATGTLSDEEKQALFDAALSDDQLFAALADEHALKEILDDSAVRAEILRATDEPKFTIAGALRQWFESPKSKALVATAAVLIAIISYNAARQTYIQRQTAEVRIEAPAMPPPDSSEGNFARYQAPPEQTKAEKAPAASKPAPKTRVEARHTRPLPAPSVEAVPPAQPMAEISSFRAKDTVANPIQWTILRRHTDGSFQPVTPDYQFIIGDAIRLRVTTNQNGAVAVAGAAPSVLSRQAFANAAVELPETGEIAITADISKLVLSFSPAPGFPAARRMATTADRGVVGGVPSASMARELDAAPSGRSIEIPIRVKKP